jgi:hypothetical protein
LKLTEPRRLSTWAAAAHLVALSAFGLAKPVLNILNAGTLIEWYLRPLDIVLAAIAIVVLPPAVLLLIELAAGLVSWQLRYWVHLAFVAGLSYLIVAYTLRKGFSVGTGLPVTLGTLAAASLAAIAYHAIAGIRSFVTVLSAAAPVFLLLYLLSSSAAKVVLPADIAAARADAAATPVVIVVFDELPVSSLMTKDERIDGTRYPTFGALARTSTWYRNAISVHDFTRFSVPAILSGSHSPKGTYAIARDHRRTLFELLARTHHLDDYEGVTRVCPRSLCVQHQQGRFPDRITSLMEQTARVYLKVVLPGRLAAKVKEHQVLPTQYPDRDLARFASALARRPSKPRFAFTYVQTPHAPYVYLPSGRRYRDPYTAQGIGRGPTPTNRLLADQLLQRHLAQVAFTDRALGRTLAPLRRSGEFDRALVVVTADHGVSLQPGQYNFEHRATVPPNASDTVSVPLFVKAPGQRLGRMNDSYATTLDIAPTVAAALGARMPWRVEGRPLDDRWPLPARVTIRRAFSPPLSVPTALILRERAAQAARVARFGSGPADPGLFHWGPRPGLLGKPVGALPARDDRSTSVDLDQPDAFASVDLGGVVPAVVSGTLSGAGAKNVRRIALAVNGRVTATAWTYVERGRVRFAAFTSDRWLRQGRNTVAVVPL